MAILESLKLLIVLGVFADADSVSRRPHIIFMIADDAGWNDFSFHGSPQIPTPNIDAIGLNGVVLNSYYSSPLCTPSRGATLTGKYAIRLGLQHYVITGGTPTGLPLKEKLLPEYLKDLGYHTHLVGKWHLGSARKVFTPTFRGFDSHYGYYLGKQDMYSHMAREHYGTGYDFRSNLTVNYEAFAEYSTDLFTREANRLINEHPENEPLFLMIAHTAPHSSYQGVPLQAPQENVDKFAETIQHDGRRHYAGLVDKLDESVGEVMMTLSKRKMLENSIVIFVSDNGGAPAGYDSNQGSNWPLRGMKNTLWEGGTRLAACMWSPQLNRAHVNKNLMHAVDWLPTLLEAAGGDISQLDNLDGVSQWQHLRGLAPPPRDSFLYNIDHVLGNAAVRHKNWKLIEGNNVPPDLGPCPEPDCAGWPSPSGRMDNSDNMVTSSPEDIALLVSKTLQSTSAAAFRDSGFTIKVNEASRALKLAEVLCQPVEEVNCNYFTGPCLFDLDEDPCEKRNLASQSPQLVDNLRNLINQFNQTAIPPIRRWNDPNSAPSKHNYVWTYFKDLEDSSCAKI